MPDASPLTYVRPAWSRLKFAPCCANKALWAFDFIGRQMRCRAYTNRSEAFRDLARAELLKESAEKPNTNVVGTVTIVYDHHVRMLSEKLTELQHKHHKCVVSSMHVHPDHDHCPGRIVLRGKSKDVRHTADSLISTKGVKLGHLIIPMAELDGQQ